MKRSSKKSRNLKKKSQKKCLLATGMMVCLGTFPVWSNDDVLLTLIPNAGKAFGSAAGIDYDYGLGAKLTYRKGDSLDFFLQGDYKRLAIDKLSPVDLMSISAGAGYHFKLNDRLGLNLSAQAGAYMASKSDGMVTGPTAGLSVSFTYRLNPVVSIEAGANVSHYAASPQPLLTDAGGSAALTVNLTEAFTDTTKVKMETNELLPVFPVLYSWYKNNAFATVGITNQEDAAIEDVTVSFYQSQFMNQPNVCAKVDKLGSGETVNAELTAFFNERMLDLTEKTDTEATVIIEYSYLGKKKKKEIGMIVPVYGRNSMSWDDDRRAAVFVSSKDPAALWFAKYISSIVRDNARPATRISQNIQYAMGIFETLDQFGLNYVIDPSSAYSDNVGGSSIDFLQFPFQTLTYRGGDCDDISILVCSLFEAVGIKTGFITIPGHIFMAFDSGLTMKEAGQSMMNTSNLFDLKGDGEAWIPLEITLTDEGFSRAWKVGAREWTTTAPEDRMFYAMEDCWKLYEPVSVPGATANFTLPEQKIVTRLFQHSMDNWIAKEISPVISQYNMLLARNESDQLRNELGILYGEYGLFVEADDQFKRARRNGYLPSLLNTANVYFARKQFAIALEWYKQVLEKDPENDLAMLGVARCNYELENFDECDKAYNYLRNKNPELANEYRYLGAFEETRGRSYSLADRLSLTIWDRGEFDSGIINDGTFEQQAELASREDENGFVTSDGANSSDFVDSDTANLFAQLTDMTDPSSVLRPDAIIADTQSYEKVPEDPYAKLDDPSVLVQELPGLIAQLRLPEPDFGNTDPVMISDYQLIAKTQPADTKTYTDAGATVVVGEKPVERTVSTQITQQQPATSTPVIAETSTKAEKKELIAFEKTDPEPTQIAQTPATTTPTVTETRPSGQTSVTTQTPVTNEPAYTTQTTVTTQTPVTTEPTQIAQTPVTTTPSVTTTQPGYTTQTTVTTQTPVTSEPTYIAQTPVTTTPSVTETRPSGQTTVTTTQPEYTTQTPVTSEPTQIAQTPVTTTPSVTETRPSGQTSVTTQTPVTNEPAYTTQTTVTTQTPVINEPTYIAQTPVTTTPSVTETRPSGQTSVTTTHPGYTTQTTVATQTPVTNEPTYIVQTPVTTTPSVTETISLPLITV
ncbi:MAG: tetratricopeptide repeat protein, partial [Treponema sp.]|nr:tetratricopeptide repeat protein [Treponema sp.]